MSDANQRAKRAKAEAENALLRAALKRARDALRNARSMLVAHGGDTTGFPKEQAQSMGLDLIHWEMLHEIDQAL